MFTPWVLILFMRHSFHWFCADGSAIGARPDDHKPPQAALLPATSAVMTSTSGVLPFTAERPWSWNSIQPSLKPSSMPEVSSLIARKLLETSIVTCAAPAYLEKHGEPRTPHDLVHHELLLFRDPQTGRPFPWEFHRGGKVIEINAAGR
jgi:hypothetical protein